MNQLAVEVEADEVGFDERRLARLDTHFRRYVDDGRLPGWLIAVSRRGKVAHLSRYGQRDVEAGLPVEVDTIWRLASMTKPITSVAAMMLYEEGLLQLTDPVSRFIPAFADARVYTGGSDLKPVTVPAVEPVRIWHLLTHTAGLTYGFHRADAVDAMYRAHGFEWTTPTGKDLAACCEILAGLPLAFQPGSSWVYSVATDVLGRVVEVVSGLPLDQFFATRIFEPLGMTDTAFKVPRRDVDRLAALYFATPQRTAVRNDGLISDPTVAPDCLSGGGGLVGTARDYHRFTQLLLGRGEVDGVRLLGSRTVAYMTRNHLPGGADLEQFGRRLFAEASYEGVGFGLGFSVVRDPAATRTLGSAGEYAWGGATSTGFWVDPAEELTALFFTQLMPSSTYPIRPELRQLVYQALVD